MSYYSDDDESVCVGLTFTHSNKLAQSSTNSTDSGVECPENTTPDYKATRGSVLESSSSGVYSSKEKTVLELSNTEMESNKCDTDSGCDVVPSTSSSQNIDDIYPGISEIKDIKTRMKALGGVEGGNVAALNARSLDILNGKFDAPSQKFALRPNPKAAEKADRRDKRPCNKTPPLNSNSASRRTSGGIIYENVSAPVRKPVYVNFRPSRYTTPEKKKCKKDKISPSSQKDKVASPLYLSPMTAAKQVPSAAVKQQYRSETVIYNTPVKRNYQSRYPTRQDQKAHSSSPHHYELILSPASSDSVTPWDSDGVSPRSPPAPRSDTAITETISSKSRSPGCLSPGQVDWGDGDSSIDKSIRSYHEAVRGNRIPSPVRPQSPFRENPLYANKNNYSKRSSPALYSTPDKPRHRSRDQVAKSRDHIPPRGRQYVNCDVPRNAYDRYNPPHLPSNRHYSVESSPGHTTSTGSLSDTEHNRPSPRRRPARDHAPNHAPNRGDHAPNRGDQGQGRSRFRYSISNLADRAPSPSSEDDTSHTKRGVVLLQATLEDIHSLYKLDAEIYELRFSDSGLTSDLVHLLGDLCNEMSVNRLIFEDCELDDWTLLCKVINQTKLSHLGFHNTNIGDEGTVRISQLISSSPSISSLDLVNCKVGCAGVAAIGVALMQNTSLKSLNLSKNPFSPKGAVLFFRALKGGNSTLQCLSLSETCCGSTEVIMMICAVLLRNTSLAYLNLNATGLTDDSITLISESLIHNTHLTSLCLSNNKLEDGSAHEIAVTLSDKNSLQHIDLSSNSLTSTALNVLIQASTVHRQIRRLDLTNNRITPRNYMDLVRIVEDFAMVGIIVF